MRVTNSMISNRSQVHISNAKNKMLTAEEQYTTMKKIQRPSEDPTIASRSLKFRTTMAQLTQYVVRNFSERDAIAEISHNNGTVDTIC